MRNEYMEQALDDAKSLERKLKAKRGPMKQQVAMANMIQQQAAVPNFAPVDNQIQEDTDKGKNGLEDTAQNLLGIRVTGFWRWKTVVVPPNLYVVHTRRGHDKPLHIGMGISFSFNPFTDSFLVIPGAMETILISANTICKELQGILIQAYVQWIIEDIDVAYKRLDFSDAEDPMRVVNLQLREQAEAAIKDKVATMSIKEVLSDKQPIIKELTKRLKEVAEGAGDGDEGLGIRIVTVQIKEAIVSSTNLWENLQKPYRAQQMTAARLAEIENASTVSNRELEERQQRETSEMETEREIEKLRSEKDAEEFDREQAEKIRRHELEQQARKKQLEVENETKKFQQEAEQKIKEQAMELSYKNRLLEKEKEYEAKKKELELQLESLKMEEEELKAEHELNLAKMNWERAYQKEEREKEAEVLKVELANRLERDAQMHAAANQQTEKELAFEEKRQKIANDLSEAQIQARAMEMLPQIAECLPHPEKLQSISISGDGENQTSLPGAVASLMAILKSFGVEAPGSGNGKGQQPPTTT